MQVEQKTQELADSVMKDLLKKLRALRKSGDGNYSQVSAQLREYADWIDDLWFRRTEGYINPEDTPKGEDTQEV